MLVDARLGDDRGARLVAERAASWPSGSTCRRCADLPMATRRPRDGESSCVHLSNGGRVRACGCTSCSSRGSTLCGVASWIEWRVRSTVTARVGLRVRVAVVRRARYLDVVATLHGGRPTTTRASDAPETRAAAGISTSMTRADRLAGLPRSPACEDPPGGPPADTASAINCWSNASAATAREQPAQVGDRPVEQPDRRRRTPASGPRPQPVGLAQEQARRAPRPRPGTAASSRQPATAASDAATIAHEYRDDSSWPLRLGRDDGQHRNARARVVVAVIASPAPRSAAASRGRRQRTARPAPTERVGNRRPADQHRHAAGGSAPHDVRRGTPLQHCGVDADIEGDRDDREGRGQRVRRRPRTAAAEPVPSMTPKRVRARAAPPRGGSDGSLVRAITASMSRSR